MAGQKPPTSAQIRTLVENVDRQCREGREARQYATEETGETDCRFSEPGRLSEADRRKDKQRRTQLSRPHAKQPCPPRYGN